MAGQWFALPKLFKDSVCEGYQVVVNERGLIQFRNEQVGFLFFFPLPFLYGYLGIWYFAIVLQDSRAAAVSAFIQSSYACLFFLFQK